MYVHYVRITYVTVLQEKMYEYGIPNAVSVFRSEDWEIFEILKFRKISGGKVLEPGPAAKVFIHLQDDSSDEYPEPSSLLKEK